MKKNQINHTDQQHLGKSIMQLASGAAISQVVVLLTTPVLTRYYSPRDFGVASFFLSSLIFLGPVSTLNYFQALILPKNERDSLSLGQLCITISVSFFLVFFLVFFSLRHGLDTIFKMPELTPIFWLFPVAILTRSLYLILAAYMSRYRAYTIQSKARICQTVFERSISLAAGFVGHASSLMLVFARFGSIVVETSLLLFAFLRRPKTRDCEPSSAKSIGDLAREYKEFPLYSSWATLLANGSSQLPLILLPLLFTPAVSGFYALGNRLFQLPMQIFSESIRNAYYKEVSDRIHQGLDNRAGFESLRNHLVAAGMFPFIFLLFFGKFIFVLFFGASWAQAGTYVSILGFFFFFQFISTPITCIFNAYKKQTYLMAGSFLLFTNNFLSLLLGAYLGSPTKGFIILTINGIAIYMYMGYLAEKTLEASHSLQFMTYMKYMAFNLPFVLSFFIIKAKTENAFVIIMVSLLFASCYYGLIYRHKLSKLLLNVRS